MITSDYDATGASDIGVFADLDDRMRQAVAEQAPAEVIYALMTDLAREMRERGYLKGYSSVSSSASALVPLFGMRTTRGEVQRCQIDEEWCGSFIGRRWCATHEVRWDLGGPCPKAGTTRAKPRWWSKAEPYTKAEIAEMIRHHREDPL